MAKSKQVLLKRSNVKGKVPALSAMTHGEMFLNYNDGVLMSKSSSNAVLKWSDDSKMATKNEVNLKLDKIEAEGSYVKNADFQYLVSEIEDNERVITTAFEKFRESAGFNENGESTLGKSLTEAISELDGVKALANKVTVDGDTVKITTLSANTFSANTVKVGSLSANTFSANTAKVTTVSANTISANTIKSNLIGIADSAKTSYSAVTSTSAKTSVSAITSFSAATAKSADSAKKLSTGRTITLSGDVTGSVSFDGSSNVILNTSISQTKKYTSLNGVPSGSDGWYSLIKLSDSLNSPAMFLIKTYPHTSVIFTVSKGYKSSGNITILQTCKQGNNGYYHIIGVRLIEDGTVQIKLNKGTSEVINISVITLNTGDSKLFDTLSIDTASQSVIHEVELADATMSSTNISANTLSATTIKTTNLSATTVSAHTIKSITMSANTLSANTVKIGSLSASTIKSTTTDDLRRDIGILSGDTYVLEVPMESLDMSTDDTYYFNLTEEEFEKIKNVRHLYFGLITPEQDRLLIPDTYRTVSEDIVYAYFTATMSSSDSNFQIVTFMLVCGEILDGGQIGGYISNSVYHSEYDKYNKIYELKLNTLTSSDKPEHNAYEDFSDSLYDIRNYKTVSVDLGGLGKYVCAPMIHDDKITLRCYTYGEQVISQRNGIPIGNSLCFTLTIYNSNVHRCYLTTEGFATNMLSESALTSYSAITTTSAKTSYSATTSTSAKTSYSATTVPASGVKGVLSSSNMPTTINKTITYTAKQHFNGDIHVCGDGTSGGAVYFGDYDEYHGEDNEPLVYIKEKDDDKLDIIGIGGVRIGNLTWVDGDYGSDGSESQYDESYAIIVDEYGSVTINNLVGYATSDEVDENNEILTKALNRLNTSAGFNSLGESTLPSGMSLTKAILELQKGGGTSDKVNVTESSSKSYIVSRETTDSDETSLHYDSAIWSENGQLYASSDKNLKEHVGNVDGNPELIKRIPKVFYHWKDDEQKRIQMGTYAQDIEKVYPEVVSRDDNGNLAVSYDRLGVIALAGIDELYKMIQDLKEENKQLRKELDSLKK